MQSLSDEKCKVLLCKVCLMPVYSLKRFSRKPFKVRVCLSFTMVKLLHMLNTGIFENGLCSM